MSISTGAQIGPFTVLGLLGQGGMGKVYRARDSRLKREVALKVLPDGFASHPERVARFQREAEVLATLTHQNIAAIHGLEEADGVRALVLELVEGPTLADRIAGGAIPVDEALPIAAQIVEALDCAHEKGVLHRDLKPANIKVTAEGQVKVLDFGLAKAVSPPDAHDQGVAPHDSPTITSPAFTQAGTILGTAAYMAPEQVRGRTVDRRADIWAFGCVLYEMLTGTRAFEGETVSDTLAAVLKNDPDWTKLPASVPGPVRLLLRRCLERSPRARLRDIADAALFLQTTPDPAGAAQTPARGRLWLAAVLGGVLTAAVLAGGWYSLRSAPSSAGGPVRRVTVQLPVDLPTSTSGGGPALAISPNGSAVAFTGNAGGQNQLYVHRLSDSTTTNIRGPANPNSQQFSSDGKWVVFGVGGGGGTTIWRAAADGGEAEGLCAAPQGFGGVRGVSSSADGRVFFGSPTGLFEAGTAGGPCQIALKLDGEREARFLWPQVLPGGRGTLLTVSAVSDDADSASIVVIPAGTTERRVIVRGARAGRVTPSGHLLFARSHQIFAAPFDLERLAMTADPVVVLDGVVSGQFGGPLLDVSDRGDLVYLPGRDPGNRLVWVNRNGERSDAEGPRRSYVPPPRLSPDGRRVAVSVGTADHFLSLYSLDTGTLTPLTGQDTHGAVWSPDNRMVAFQMGGRGIAIKNVETTGEPEVVLEGLGTASTWSPDGTTIVANRPSGAGGSELLALRVADRTTQTLLRARQPFADAQFSPDGRWLAYASNESGRTEVYVTDFPAARFRKPVSTNGGSAPVWARNGRELFYVSGAAMMAAAVRPGVEIGFERPVRLFAGIVGMGNVNTYSVAPDGRFLFVEGDESDRPDRSQLTLVLNWLEELNRLVPTR